MGWSISGLSAITRCPRTMAQDGVTGAVSFDANDRFCLDGQRLVAVNGDYGADGTEYRTELERYSKIVSYGIAGSGPAWLKVWTRDGQILEYGNTADSRIEAQGKSSVRVWAIDRISDTMGSYLAVSYREDSTDGDYYPSRIDYTGNDSAGLTPNNSVQFGYETRTDVSPQYIRGSLVRNAMRLKTINTWNGGTVVREYRLAYRTGRITGRSRINSVSVCEMAAGACKPATSFELAELDGLQ